MIHTKDPDEILDYGCDWAPWLAGDTITSSTWEVPTGLTKGTDTFDATTTTVWLSAGVPGAIYTVINRVATDAGRQGEGVVRLRIRSN